MMDPMEISEKPQAHRPRVVHGPHRLRMSGIVPQSSVPAGELMSTVAVGDFEIVTKAIEISVELISFDEPG